MNPMSRFIEWLKSELNHRAWNYSDLGRRGGIAPSTISMVVSGQSKPGPDFCKGVARAFGIRDEEVFRRVGILDPLPPEVEEEREILLLIRALPPDTRCTVIAMLHGLVDEHGRQPSDPLPNT